MSATGWNREGASGIDPKDALAIKEVLIGTPGVQTVGEVVLYRGERDALLVTATLGFGPSTPVSDVVALLREVKAGIRAAIPSVSGIVLEPEVAAPRTDADPPTDTIVIRGAD